MKRLLASVSMTIMVAACASQPEDIHTAYVSTLRYSVHDCDQLSMEAERVSARTIELYHSLNKKADDDAVQMGVGLVLLWPTLFFLEGGDGAQAQEYSQLKGERNAIEKASIEKKCGIEFAPIEVENNDNTDDTGT